MLQTKNKIGKVTFPNTRCLRGCPYISCQFFLCLLIDLLGVFCRGALDSEICKYVVEAYHNGVSAVYCIDGKDVEELHTEFKFVVVISAARHSPHNFWCVVFFIILNIFYLLQFA